MAAVLVVVVAFYAAAAAVAVATNAWAVDAAVSSGWRLSSVTAATAMAATFVGTQQSQRCCCSCSCC